MDALPPLDTAKMTDSSFDGNDLRRVHSAAAWNWLALDCLTSHVGMRAIEWPNHGCCYRKFPKPASLQKK